MKELKGGYILALIYNKFFYAGGMLDSRLGKIQYTVYGKH